MRYLLTLTHYSIYLFLAIFTLVSCKKNLEEERTFSENQRIERFIALNKWTYNKVGGIYHVVLDKSFGYQVAKGDTIEFNYTGYTLDGKVFDTNVDTIAKKAKLDTNIRSFLPLKLIAGESNLIDGLNYGLLQIREGERAFVLFSSSLGYGGDVLGSVDAWSPLAYDIKLIKVNSPSIQQEKSYISSLNLTGFSEDNSGLFYKYEHAGVGLTPTKTDTIFGWYKGTLPDGTVIKDLGIGNQKFVLTNDTIPEGLRLGFMLTQSGGSTDLVIPSFLGFGNMGFGVVGPYQTIFYQIRLDSIK